MKPRKYLYLALLFACFTFIQVAAQKPGLDSDTSRKIDDLIKAAISENKIPAISVAIVSDNGIRYANGFGMADLENSVPAKPGTVYRLGSLSKTITATAVMRLVEESKLDLDLPIQKY